jgi:hypothetical protein
MDAANGHPRPVDSAHYAWARDTARRREETARLGISYAPQPLQPSAAAVGGGGGGGGGGAEGGSAWNAAGTTW